MEEARARRERQVQGELLELAGDPAPGVPPPDTAPAAVEEEIEADPDDDPADRLVAALARLERRVGSLVEWNADLAARYRETRAARAEADARLERIAADGSDPEELAARIESLEADRDRLATHAAFLEEEIRGLLTRVRYVIES